MADASIQAAYLALAKASESKPDLTEAEKEELWPRITALGVNEADTAYHLMKYHRRQYPRRGRSVNDDYPYDMVEVVDEDVGGEKVSGTRVYASTLPMKLVKILREYVDTLNRVDE